MKLTNEKLAVALGWKKTHKRRYKSGWMFDWFHPQEKGRRADDYNRHFPPDFLHSLDALVPELARLNIGFNLCQWAAWRECAPTLPTATIDGEITQANTFSEALAQATYKYLKARKK